MTEVADRGPVGAKMPVRHSVRLRLSVTTTGDMAGLLAELPAPRFLRC